MATCCEKCNCGTANVTTEINCEGTHITDLQGHVGCPANGDLFYMWNNISEESEKITYESLKDCIQSDLLLDYTPVPLPVGVWGDGDNVAQITVDAEGIITDITNVPINHPAIPDVISDLSDVDDSARAEDYILVWNSVTMNWEAEATQYFSGDYGDLVGAPTLVEYINDLLDVDTGTAMSKDHGDIMFWNKDTQLWEAVKPYHSVSLTALETNAIQDSDTDHYIDFNNYRLVLPEGVWEVEMDLTGDATHNNISDRTVQLEFSAVYNTNSGSLGPDGSDVAIPSSVRRFGQLALKSILTLDKEDFSITSSFEVTVPAGTSWVIKPIFIHRNPESTTARINYLERNIRARFIRNQ